MKLLTPNRLINTVINWTNQYTKEKTGSISVSIILKENDGTITFDYKYRDSEEIKYTTPTSSQDRLIWEMESYGFSFVRIQKRFAENYI